MVSLLTGVLVIIGDMRQRLIGGDLRGVLLLVATHKGAQHTNGLMATIASPLGIGRDVIASEQLGRDFDKDMRFNFHASLLVWGRVSPWSGLLSQQERCICIALVAVPQRDALVSCHLIGPPITVAALLGTALAIAARTGCQATDGAVPMATGAAHIADHRVIRCCHRRLSSCG